MAQEAKRGCGYRRVGGIYLVADGLWASCDRLPFAVGCCPTCHGGIKFPRAPLEIDPMGLFGVHDPCKDDKPHTEIIWVNDTPTGDKSVGGCQVCFPRREVAYLLGVGEQSYKLPGDFMEEAVRLGGDPKTWLKSQFVRLPNGQREDGTIQRVEFFDA